MQKKHQIIRKYSLKELIANEMAACLRTFSPFYTNYSNLSVLVHRKYNLFKMKEEEKAALRKKILETITLTEEKISGLEEATQPISPENSIGRVSRMDAINNKSVAEAALRSSKEKLSKLKLALTKLDRPEFGICVFCKNPIPPARLMYMPESTRCVRCADR